MPDGATIWIDDDPAVILDTSEEDFETEPSFYLRFRLERLPSRPLRGIAFG